MTTLRVLAPGAMTTVQDGGRRGWRHLGVCIAGALDPAQAALANRLVGNAPDAAVLELAMTGPTLAFARVPDYSCFSTTTGSTRIARRAGT